MYANDDKETLRHFVLLSKGWYKNKTIEDLICKITGSNSSEDVRMNSIMYWLRKTCVVYGIGGYDIIDLFINKSESICYESENELEQLAYVMKVKLQMIQVKDNGKVIEDLGKPDLFN